MAESAAGYLLAEEYLSAGDERFVETILALHDPKRLSGLAEKWKKDHRSTVRGWLEAYLDRGLQSVSHDPVVKRLFKQAEERRDDEQLAMFMAGFERIVRRKLRNWRGCAAWCGKRWRKARWVWGHP